mmetsp:Transcript_15156/g.44377  ORF Transcript_15156/g.44377 Transcript_15156/m.44377 type:complete len:211 (-) Transcript_15156:75-707(-)
MLATPPWAMAATRPAWCRRHIFSACSRCGSTSSFSTPARSMSSGTVWRPTTSAVTGCATSTHRALRALQAWARTCCSGSLSSCWSTGTESELCMWSRPCLSCAMRMKTCDTRTRTVPSSSSAPAFRAGTRPTLRNLAISIGALHSLSIIARAFCLCTSSSALMSFVSFGCVARSNASVTASAGNSSGLGMHANCTRCVACLSKPVSALRS